MKISSLNPTGPLNGSEQVPVNKNGSKRTTVAAIAALGGQVGVEGAAVMAAIYAALADYDGAGLIGFGGATVADALAGLAGVDEIRPGYDIIAGFGDSNGVGQGLPPNPMIDVADARIFQFPHTGPGAGTAVEANDPLRNRNDETATGKVGSFMSLARTYLPTLNINRNILLVPHCSSGSGMEEGSSWGAGLAAAECYITAYPATGGGVAGHTITLDGHTVTLVAAGAAGQQINIGADAAALIANLRAYIVANVGSLSFTTSAVEAITDQRSDGTVETYSQIVLTQKAAGVAGNAKTVTQSGSFSFLANVEKDTTFVCGCDAGRGTLLNEFVTRTNAAMALGTGFNRLALISCWIGTNDPRIRPARLSTELKAIADYLRTAVTGATATTPVVFNGQVPEYVATDAALASYDRIARTERALARLPFQNNYVEYIQTPTGSNSVALGETIFHHDAPILRTMGATAVANRGFALRNGPIGAPGLFVISAAQGTALGAVDVSWVLPATGSTQYTALNLRYRKGLGAWVEVAIPLVAKSWGLTGLDFASAYEFQIRATNAQGVGSWSASAFAETQAVPSLLDNLVLTANAAFSLRKVRADYAGACLRARRSSDNTEMDIGFNANGLMDTVTLLAFAAGGDAFLKTWYDQEGANNGTQPTAGQQPRIVQAGVLVTNNGLPAVDFYNNGSTAVHLPSSTGFPVAADFTMNAVIYEGTGAGTNHLIGPDATGNHSLMLGHQPIIFVGGILVSGASSAPAGTRAIAGSYIASTKTGRIFQDGEFLATGTNAIATTGTGFHLGTYNGTYGFQLFGKMMEAIIFPTALNDVQVAALAAANAAHWGTGG